MIRRSDSFTWEPTKFCFALLAHNHGSETSQIGISQTPAKEREKKNKRRTEYLWWWLPVIPSLEPACPFPIIIQH